MDRIASRERVSLKETLFQPLPPRLPLLPGNRYVYRGCLPVEYAKSLPRGCSFGNLSRVT